MDNPEEIPTDNPLFSESENIDPFLTEGVTDEVDEPTLYASDEREEIAKTEIPLDIGDLYIILLDSLTEPSLATIAAIQEEKAIFEEVDGTKRTWEFLVKDGQVVKETDDYTVLDMIRVRKLDPEDEEIMDLGSEEVEFETDELTLKKYSELAIKDDLLNTMIKRLGIYENPLLIDKVQQTIEILLGLIQESKEEKKSDTLFPKGMIPIVSNQLKFYDEMTLNEELQSEAELLESGFSGYQNFLENILKNQSSFEPAETLTGFDTENYEGTFLLDCLQSETCQGLQGSYTYDERKTRKIIRGPDRNRILMPSERLNIDALLLEPIFSSVWSIDQNTFHRFTVLEKILYEHFWKQLQYRKRKNVSEMIIQGATAETEEDEETESVETDNYTFLMYSLSSDTSIHELFNRVNPNTIVEKLLSEEKLCKYLMNFNDIENVLFKYRISISQINEEHFAKLQKLFQKNIRRYQMDYAKSIKGPKITEELKTRRISLTNERRVSLSYEYIFRILEEDLRNHYLQKFIDIFTRPADKASESKDFLYNKFTNERILCRHYLYLVNAKNDNDLFMSMKSIYGLPAADGYISCRCCGAYLCPEETSLFDGFSDDKPIQLREVMRSEAEGKMLEKQEYLEKEEELAKLIQLFGNAIGITLTDEDKVTILQSYELKDNVILSEQRYNLKGIAEYPDVHPRVESKISEMKKEEKQEKDKKKRKKMKSNRDNIFPSFQKWLRDTNKILMIVSLVAIYIQTAVPAFIFKRGLVFKVIDIQTMSIHKPGLEYIVEKIKKLRESGDPLWECIPDLLKESENKVNDIVRQLANTMMYCVGYNNPPMVDRIQKYKDFVEAEKKRYLKEEWVTFRPLSGNKLVQAITKDLSQNVSENEGLLKKVYGGIPIENIALVRSLEMSRHMSLAEICKIPQFDIIKNAAFNRFFKYVISCYGIHPNNIFIIMTVNRMIQTLSENVGQSGAEKKIDDLKEILKKGGWNESTGGFKSLNFKKLREVVIPEILSLYGDKNGELKSCYDNATSCSGYIHNSVNNYDLTLLNTFPKRVYSYTQENVYPDLPFERLKEDKPELVEKIFSVYKMNALGEIVTEKQELFYDQFLVNTLVEGLETPTLPKGILRKNDVDAESFELIFHQLRTRNALDHHDILCDRQRFKEEDYNAIKSYSITEYHFLRYLRRFQGVWISEEEQQLNESLNTLFEVFDKDEFQWSSLDEAKKSALRTRRDTHFSDCIRDRDIHMELLVNFLTESTKIEASQKTRLEKAFFEGTGRYTKANLFEMFNIKFLNNPHFTGIHCKRYLSDIKMIFQQILSEKKVAQTQIPKEWKLTEYLTDQFQAFMQRDYDENSLLLLHNRFFAVKSRDKYTGFNRYLNRGPSHILHIRGLYQYVSWLLDGLDFIQGSENETSFFTQKYSDIYLKYILMRFFGICTHYIQELRNDHSDVASDANDLYSALETRDETLLDEAIDTCSTFVMDLVTNILFMHYDPDWLFMNEQKLELAFRLSKQKESEKQFFIEQFDSLSAEERTLMIQKQKVGMSNWHKTGGERSEAYVQSEEYADHTEEERRMIFKGIDADVAEQGAMFNASMNQQMGSQGEVDQRHIDPSTHNLELGLRDQETGYYDESQLDEENEESMGGYLDEELQQTFNE